MLTILIAYFVVFLRIGGRAEELPWCTNNSHIEGEWLSYKQPIEKSFVCCGGGYAGPYGKRLIKKSVFLILVKNGLILRKNSLISSKIHTIISFKFKIAILNF
jgi:hypothetical protein